MTVPDASAPYRRDRSLRRLRVLRWGVGLGAAGLTAGFSVVAANAFKGHTGTSHAAVQAPAHHARRLSVPRPERVLAIANDPTPLAAPSAPPAAAPSQPAPAQPAPAPAPQATSGGS